MRKRILSVGLSIAMLLSLLPGTALAMETVETDPEMSYVGTTQAETLADIEIRYGGQKLDGALQSAYQALASGIGKAEVSIDVQSYNLSTDNLNIVMNAVLSDYPEYFWIGEKATEGGIGYYSYSINGAIVTSVTPTYNGYANNLETSRQSVESKVSAVLENLSGSDYEKALELHDWLAEHVEYVSNEDDQNIYGALVTGRAVCAGYARAYQYLLNQAGIESWYVTGTSKNPTTGQSVGHAWNVVLLKDPVDAWYYVDVTWDDQGEDLFHAYFLCGTEHINEDHTPDSEFVEENLPATGSADNYYFAQQGSGTLIESYSTDAVAEGLEFDGTTNFTGHFYVTGDVQAFAGNFDSENGSFSNSLTALAEKLGLTGQISGSVRNLGREFVITVTGTPSNPPSPPVSDDEEMPEGAGVAISGDMKFNGELTANVTGFTDSPQFSYQWYRNDAEISGATHNAYTLVAADVGAAIKVVVKAEGYDGELTATTSIIAKTEQEPLTITTTGPAKVGVGYTLATSGGSINGAVTYQITLGSENAIIEGDELTPLHAGQVTVIATMAGNGSYKDVTSAPVVITIQPGILDYVGKTASGNIKANTAGSVELPATIVEGSYGTPVASVDSGVITELEIKGNVLNYTGGSSVVGGQTYTVTIPVDNGSDYEKYDIIVTLTGTTKDSPIVEVEDLSVTYTGKPVPISAISGTVTFQGAVVDGTWTWADDVPQEIGFGDYNVTFTPTDGNKYAPVTVSVRVAVTKAVPQISLVITNADTDQNVTNGTIPLNTGINLSVDVALPDGLIIPATEFASIYYSCGDKNLGNGSLEGAVYAKIEGNEWIPGQTYTVTARFTGISFLEEVTANATLTIASNTEPVPQTFTVTFHANNGTGATSVMTVDQGESLTLPSCSFTAPSGYRFAHWAFNAPGGNPYNAGYNFGQISADAAFYAVWEPIPTPIPTPDPEPSAPSGGGNDDYDDANDDDRDDPNVTTGDNRQPGGGTTTETTARPTVNASNGSANATVSPSMGNTIVDQARSNHSNTVTIAPEISGSVDRTQVTIPNNVVSQLGRETNADLVVSTPVADVTIPNGALSSLAGRGGRVSVTAEMAGNTVTVEVVVGSESVSSVRDGLNVAVPVADATAGTVAVLVHEDGTREVIRKSVVQDGVLTMTLDGSSTIEIVDNSKDFADVPENNWAAEAVAFASGHELFNGTSENTFSPDESMSRGMLAQVLYSLESNPDVIAFSTFNDVTGGEWYADAVYWAANQGIVTGYTDGTFGANDSITREQLAVMLYRYAESSGYDTSANADLSVYWDSGNISAYAARAMAWATAEGLISGTTATTLEPGASATRAQVATILMRFCQNVQ